MKLYFCITFFFSNIMLYPFPLAPLPIPRHYPYPSPVTLCSSICSIHLSLSYFFETPFSFYSEAIPAGLRTESLNNEIS